MAYLTLVTGGCRSGKSDFGQQLAEESEGERLFIATSPCFDEEMEERIISHRLTRENKGWQTVEEEFCPEKIILAADDKTTVLLDCLTLWISNLLFESEEKKEVFNRPDPRDGIDILTKVGGFEIGGIAGLILGAPPTANLYWLMVLFRRPGP